MAISNDALSLYHFRGCPWCERVHAAIVDLDLPVELRDVRREAAHMAELHAAVGRGTVPVLRTDRGDEAHWLPESKDIVEHLYRTYGQDRRPTFFATSLPQQIGLGLTVVLGLAAFLAPEPQRSPLIAAAVVAFALRNSMPLLRRIVGPRG